MNKERGSLDYIIIAICLLFILLAVGFFRSDKGFFGKVNFKAALQLPCGITVLGIEKNEKISFPHTVKGYINGCGWERGRSSAGVLQVFDSKGLPVTAALTLEYGDDGTTLPTPFVTQVIPTRAPSSGEGMIVFTSTTGLIHTIPIQF